MTPNNYLKVLFLLVKNLIQKYQRSEPSLKAKYKYGTYHKGSFRGGSNIDLGLITYIDNIVIPSKLKSYVLHWYHTYLLHPGMDRTEAVVCHHLYCLNIRDSVRKEVNNCDTCQRTKLPNKNYGKLPAKLAEEIPWYKLCLDLIGPYVVRGKGGEIELTSKSHYINRSRNRMV